MLSFIKNKNATILPVTIVSMFIMIIIAYTCIKMFLVQNVMATTDQLRIRTRYAAEGLMEKEKTNIYRDIRDINQQTNIKIANGTVIGGFQISNLETTGTATNFKNLKAYDIPTGIYPSESDNFPKGETMFPDITGRSTLSFCNHESWLEDYGLTLYKNTGITAIYGNYINLNRVVYGNQNKIQNVDSSWAKEDQWVAFVDTTALNYSNVQLTDEEIVYRDKTYSDVSLQVAKNVMHARYKDKPFNSISFCAYTINYVVLNSSQGYVITSEANAEVSHKIPQVTSKINLYFDIFMTQLYRKCTLKTVRWIGTKSFNPSGQPYFEWTTASAPSQTRYLFLDDTNKYINNIKFHIQKWEVIS